MTRRRYVTGPTILTILRMLLAIIFAALLMIPNLAAKIAALVIFISAAVTDKIDGIWARKSGKVTDLGAFLDPLADKMLTSLAFLILVYQGIVPLWVFAVILVRDLAVDGLRMSAAKDRVTISASSLGKLKTTAQMLTIATLLLDVIVSSPVINIIGNIILYIALALTIFSGLDYLIKGWKQIAK